MLADRIRMSFGKSRKLIDRTEPNLVSNLPHYKDAHNGGRKIVRMDDGTLVTIVHQSTDSLLYKSIDKGLTWNRLKNIGYDATDMAIVAKDDNIYVLYTYGYVISMRAYSKEGKIVYSTNIVVNQQEVSTCSLALDKEKNELHACWSSKDYDFPNNFNIRYCKGSINDNSSVTWDAIEQVSLDNNGLTDNIAPSIVIKEGYPIVVYYIRASGAHRIACRYKLPTETWKYYQIINGGRYVQSSPSLCIDKNGVIHLAWRREASDSIYKVRYCKSYNGGKTWEESIDLPTYSGVGLIPSVCTNSSGDIFVHAGSIIKWVSNDGGMNWSTHGYLSNMTNASLLDDNTLDFEEPLGVYRTTANHEMYPNSVVFRGKWYE